MKGPFSSSLCLNKSWVGFWQLIQREQHRAKSPPSYLWHHHCHLKCPHGVHVGHNDGNPWVGLLRISKCEGTLEIHLLAKREKKCFALCDLCRISRVWSKWKKTTKKVYIPWSQDSLSAEPGVPKTGASLRKPSNGLLSRYKSWTWLLNILECQHKAVDVLPSSPASKSQVLSLNSLSQPPVTFCPQPASSQPYTPTYMFSFSTSKHWRDHSPFEKIHSTPPCQPQSSLSHLPLQIRPAVSYKPLIP